jgi:phosphatidylglycerophosphate synthase
MLSKFGLDPNNWKDQPYTFLKTRFYIEASSAITYLFLRLGVSANTTTFLYLLFGFLGCLLIAVGSVPLLYLGILLVFVKSVFDWADGPIARWEQQESLKGHIFDLYGARFNSLCFVSSLGLYSYRSTDDIIFLYFLIGYGFVCSNIITSYASDQLLRSLLNEKVRFYSSSDNEDLKISSGLANLPKSKLSLLIQKLAIFRHILDDRARSVDLLLLIIIFEQTILPVTIIPYAFLFMAIKQILYFLIDWFIFYKGSWMNNFEANGDAE